MLRTILFFAYFWLTLALSLPFCAVFLVFELLGLWRLSTGAVRAFVSAWARHMLWATGSRATVSGLERVPPEGGLCFVANHQGNIDIILLLAFLPRAAGYVAKSQAVWFPFINAWIAVLGSVFIDRKNVSKARLSIAAGAKRLASGRSIAIFPEGTRSRRASMGPFRNGSFKLATMAGATIVPVTMNRTYHVWEESSRIRGAELSMTFHDPIPTAGMGPAERKALPDHVRAVIQSALEA